MNPFQQNVANQSYFQSNNNNLIDQKTQSRNYSMSDSQMSRHNQQFLLDDISANTSKSLTNNIFTNEIQGNFSIKKNTHMESGPNASNFQLNQISGSQYDRMNQAVSKFDRQLEMLMNMNENQQTSQSKKFITKEIIQKEQRNRKTMKRLSQQFFPKATCELVQSNIKSKIKSRQTFACIGGRNKLDGLDQNRRKTGTVDLFSGIEKAKLQQMQTEEEPQLQGQTNIFNEKENSNLILNQQNYSVQFGSPKSLTKSSVQRRLSEGKLKRQRLTMDRDNLVNLLRNMDEQEKKKEIKIQKQKQRVTIDFFNIVKFISQAQAPQKTQIKPSTDPQKLLSTNDQPITQPSLFPMQKQQKLSRRLTELFRPIQPQKIIIQDEKQDQFTPMKNYSQDKNNLTNQYDGSLIFGKKPQSQKKKPIDYQKYVFEEFLSNIKDKLARQKKVVQELRKQRQQIIAQNTKQLTQFKMTAKSIQQIENQQKQLASQINHLKHKLNPQDYVQYKKIINSFQLKFGIKIHRYDKIIKSSHSQGYYVQFTLDNLICRIKRNSAEQPFALKFQPCLGIKNQDLYLTSFGYQWRTLIYSNFISKKLLNTTHFLSFMVNFQAYIEELNKLQITYDFISNMYEVRNPQINEGSLSLDFELGLFGKYEFMFRIDLLKLRQNEGIQILSMGENNQLRIPEEVTKWTKGGNKLMSSINFIIDYCHQSMNRETENQIEHVSSGNK